MDAYEGYCISKGIKLGTGGVKPAAKDVRRWKALIEQELEEIE